MSLLHGIDWRHGPPLPRSRPFTLPDLVAAALARAGKHTVLRDNTGDWSWPQLETAARHCASAWSTVVPRDTVVAIELPNGVAHLIAVLATWCLGAVAAPLSTCLPTTQRSAVLRRLAPTLVISDPQQVFTAITHLALLPWFPAQAHDRCFIMATSGSTGQPRLVVLTHDNLCSQQAAFAALWPEVGPGDRLAGYLPWHHSFGALAECLWSLCRGACLTVVPGSGRDLAAFSATLRTVRPTIFFSVPKLHRVAQELTPLELTSLRWAFTAGAALSPECATWYAQRNIPVVEGWGLTETSPSATITRSGFHHPGVVGQPIPGVSVGIDPDGHILVTGPGVMAGYLDSPALNIRLLPDGTRVLDTGDLGCWDNADVRLFGRADHTTKLANGETVDLGAIEHFLENQPGISAAAVRPIDHASRLQAILAATHDAAEQACTAWNVAAPAPWHRVAEQRILALTPSVDNGLLTASNKTSRPGMFAVVDHHE